MEEVLFSSRERLNRADKKSVQILEDIQTSEWYRVLNGELVVYKRNKTNQLVAAKRYSLDEFYGAAKYLYENRDSEGALLYATETNTHVKIYEPAIYPGGEKKLSRSRGVVMEMSILRMMSVFETIFLLHYPTPDSS